MFLIKIGLKNQWFFHKKNDGKAWIFQEKQWKTWIFIRFFLKFIEFFKENRVFQWKVMRKHDFEWKNHEQPWFSMKNHGKTLIFIQNLRKTLNFWAFALRANKKTENHTRWGPEGAPPEARRQKAQPFGEICGNKIPHERCLRANECFFISKNQTLQMFLYPKISPVSTPTDWENSRNMVAPTMNTRVLEDFGGRRAGLQGRFQEAWGRQGWVTRELRSQAKMNKQNEDF